VGPPQRRAPVGLLPQEVVLAAPLTRPRTPHLLRKRGDVCRVPPPRGVFLAHGAQQVERVRTDHVEHAVPWQAIPRPRRRLHADQVGIDERGNGPIAIALRSADRPAAGGPISLADGLRRRERAAAREDLYWTQE